MSELLILAMLLTAYGLPSKTMAAKAEEDGDDKEKQRQTGNLTGLAVTWSMDLVAVSLAMDKQRCVLMVTKSTARAVVRHGRMSDGVWSADPEM